MDQNLLIPLTVFVVVACFALLLQLGVLLAAFIAVLVSLIRRPPNSSSWA